ncbi:hypothetical protein [Candidatus Thiodiazotropha sp. CDECU1]|uniref:hypothetical protein n=1 Tax=Candidatus Thiodiazotropha sp. CDECU1 TaxID=3065865 RepID=UPI00292D9AC6|nr:hypothetical protein [Candidatus Thiodiazotropha sp. CDECU1]
MYHKHTLSIIIFIVFFALQGCGGGGGGSNVSSDTQTPGTYTAYTDLIWIPPKTREDGSYLISSNIAGYKVYYGTDSDNLKMLVDLQEAGIDEYRIGVPSSGSYFFAISVYDTEGVEGELSNIVLKDAIPF